ncbi:hypothetical protein BB558_007652 [Smittium angustum]|uniref:Serine/threonine-protein phosphatase 2A 56 kDa regulatory subunit n=1 Tax=Smittium angustum TaxID=133377 RepID=A0A2U1IUJ1_SMIAN|nr:hypothetical protein BB558_007652 [Smittium angustum]
MNKTKPLPQENPLPPDKFISRDTKSLKEPIITSQIDHATLAPGPEIMSPTELQTHDSGEFLRKAINDSYIKSKHNVPQVDEVQSIRSLRRPRSSRFNVPDKREFRIFPLIEDSRNSEGDMIKLFSKKVDQCSIVFDFSNPNSNLKAKDAKRTTLEELVEYISKYPLPRSETAYRQILNMVGSNIFRNLAPQNGLHGEPFDPEEDEPSMEPAWSHLELIYIFFQRFLENNSFDESIARKVIDQKFALQLLELFDTEDPREREMLKTVLHRIYGKILSLRSFIRKSINHIFLQFIYESDRHNGITELLEILGSIINGFTIPLKDEHKVFLRRVLLPLHKAKPMSTYHPQLAYCTVQFIEKDPSLAHPIVISLLKFWPKVNSPKEVMFLNELEEVLEVIGLDEFETFHIPLFQQLGKCIVSPHFQVADRALAFWRNEHIAQLIHSTLDSLAPIVLHEVYKSCSCHWNASIHQHAYAVFKFFMLSDEQLFDNIINQLRNSHRKGLVERENRKEKWTRLYNKVKSENPGVVDGKPVILVDEATEQVDVNAVDQLELIIEHVLSEQVGDENSSRYTSQSPNSMNINPIPTPSEPGGSGAMNSSQSVPFYDSYNEFGMNTQYSLGGHQALVTEPNNMYYESGNSQWQSHG